tara:strand:+ start:823 stop:996 length:174 start_codon:yes stop_codon:yes gene_type:complete
MTKHGGGTKSVIVKAKSCKEAEKIVAEKYPKLEILRVSSNQQDVDYFKAMKLAKKGI